MKYLFVIIPLVGLFACANLSKNNVAAGQLTGVWFNTYMKVDMYSYRGSDSLKSMEVTEKNWEEKLQIRPIETHFNENGTYNSIHRNLKDSIVYNPAGYWSVKGDSLFMRDTFPQVGPRYHYKFAISSEGKTTQAEFWGVEDFDQDGSTDDTYYGKQRKK